MSGNDDAKAAAERAKKLRQAGRSRWVGSGKNRRRVGKDETRLGANRKRAGGKKPGDQEPKGT